ncbi:hypothetical protein KSF73_12250 [Burkholderiaceae bacterium DAT-1]|nr:hypothetical protein [Burkholderiaceae bacterium DAT-1]
MNAALKAVHVQRVPDASSVGQTHWLRPFLTLLLLTIPGSLAAYLLFGVEGELGGLDVLIAGAAAIAVLAALKLTAYDPHSPIYANEAEDLCRVQHGQQAFGQSVLRFRLHAVPAGGGALAHLEHKPWRHDADDDHTHVWSKAHRQAAR